MKIQKRSILGVVAILAGVFLTSGVVYAQDAERITTVAAGDHVSGDFWNAANTITVNGVLEGDTGLAGGSITLTDTSVVKQNGYIVGGNIVANGSTEDSLHVAGGQITINGAISRNLYVAGGQILIDKNATVNGNVYVAGGTVDIHGTVKGSVKAAGGATTITGSVGNGVSASTDQLIIGDGATITGDVQYWSTQQASVSSKATISGAVTQHQPVIQKQSPQSTTIARIYGALVGLLGAFVVGAIGIALFRKHATSMSDTLDTRFWRALGVGALKLVLTPLVLIILLVTIIGIPLALIGSAAFAVEIYVSTIIVALWFGRFIVRRMNYQLDLYWSLLIGLVIVNVVYFIPILGGLMRLVVLLLGLGAIGNVALGWMRELKPEKPAQS